MQREHRTISRGGRRALALGAALALAVAGSGSAFAAASNPIAAQEWALNTLQNAEIHSKFNARGSGVIVAVVDTGVDPNQPDLQGRLVDGVNLVDPSSPTGDFGDTDSKSHGTSVATVIAANAHKDSGGNQDGMLGLADEAKIMPVKAGVNGGTSSESLAAGILYAVNHGAQVINISQATTVSDSNVTSAINNALAHGVVVVVGTGNTGESGNAPNTVATVPGVIDVSGIDQSEQIYHPGHNGSDVDVAAPANLIEVGLTGGNYGQQSGTSLAAPWVSAEAALIIGLHPTWTSGQIVADIIDNTAQVANGQTKTGQRVDNFVGYGVIDPVAALGAAEPSNTANPLGGPAITSNPAENVKGTAGASAGATAPAAGPTGAGTAPVASAKSSSKAPLIIGIVVVVVVLIALLVFLLSRRNRGGRGGPGGGGGGSNGYYTPPNPPGGQYAVPPQQHNPYQAAGPNNPYAQPQPQQGAPGGAYPPPPQAGAYPPPQAGSGYPGYPPPPQAGGEYGQQQNPFSGR